MQQRDIVTLLLEGHDKAQCLAAYVDEVSRPDTIVTAPLDDGLVLYDKEDCQETYLEYHERQ